MEATIKLTENQLINIVADCMDDIKSDSQYHRLTMKLLEALDYADAFQNWGMIIDYATEREELEKEIREAYKLKHNETNW